jgi:RNA polymerase sigma-70 factor (family 1)
MKDQTDESLISLCKEGRREAFNELVRRYQDRLYWMIRRMTGDPDEAYDIAQDVFVRAWQGIDSYRGDAKFYTWLYRIATNLSLNHLRARKVREWFNLDELEHILVDTEDTPDTVFERKEMRGNIARAVERLPEKQKAVFILRYFEELPYEDIASIMKRSVGASKANYFHALRKIENHLKNEL